MDQSEWDSPCADPVGDALRMVEIIKRSKPGPTPGQFCQRISTETGIPYETVMRELERQEEEWNKRKERGK